MSDEHKCPGCGWNTVATHDDYSRIYAALNIEPNEPGEEGIICPDCFVQLLNDILAK